MKNIENVTVRKKIRKAFKPSKIATLDRLKNFMFSGYNEGKEKKELKNIENAVTVSKTLETGMVTSIK